MAITWGNFKKKIDAQLHDDMLIDEIVCYTMDEHDTFHIKISSVPLYVQTGDNNDNVCFIWN